MKYDILESIRAELDKCTKCASCQAGCYTYELTSSETLAARGKIRLAQGVLAGEIDITDRVANDFTQCLSCMSCLSACPTGVDTMQVFSAMKAEMHRQNGPGPIAGFIFKWLLPYPRRLNVLAKLVGFASIFYKWAPARFAEFFPFTPGGIKRVTPNFLKLNLRLRVPTKNPAKNVNANTSIKRVIYYTGCMTDLSFTDTGVTVIKRLQEMGVEVIYPKDQVCCGAPSYYSGDMETSIALAKKNIKVLSAYEADAIVYSCATCGSVLAEKYPKMFPNDKKVAELCAKVTDLQKLMMQIGIEQAVKQKADGKKLKVTYHDPCHLKRGMGVWKEPRELLKSLPGVEFVEMKNADRCCGGSGTFGLNFYDMSMDVGKLKADAIYESGADIVVTACPSCQIQIEDSLHRHGYDIPTAHTIDLIDYALSPCQKTARETKSDSSTNSKSAVKANH
ncbi:Predicted glycolate dehydrogenase, 2-subunit type, iron-sulfur subunit GlcF [hydrothermal vent metagenome]|uniref:Predicted glycolate dehydrogenase, 2-subunit type, iron-sulfur subunit GlcF n=1 Tax=hydrothermal vent metagenome TaxID=652676 RepID=A0A3B1BIW5_9ZZZZ